MEGQYQLAVDTGASYELDGAVYYLEMINGIWNLVRRIGDKIKLLAGHLKCRMRVDFHSQTSETYLRHFRNPPNVGYPCEEKNLAGVGASTV